MPVAVFADGAEEKTQLFLMKRTLHLSFKPIVAPCTAKLYAVAICHHKISKRG
jgi:hypothetical protein